jgi:TRAP-type mannitol/chloroaromatic compound transport system permease small subunit
MGKIFRCIDSINQWIGDFLPPCMLVMAVITAWEVAMRYIFSSPTKWVWPINLYILTLVGLAGGYCSLKNTHIRVDILTNNLSPRVKAFLEAITAPALFIFIGCVAYWTFSETVLSFTNNEWDNHWLTPIPPYLKKGLVFVGAFLFFLQGVAKFLRDIHTVIHGAEGKATGPEGITRKAAAAAKDGEVKL